MTSSKYAIRDMRLADADRIAAMIAGLADHIAEGLIPKTTAADIVKYGPFGTGHFRALVADRGGELHGLCLYTTLFSGWRGRPGLHVLDLYVEETARGVRLGKCLLITAVQRSRELGCTFVKLEVSRRNEGAKAFYGRLGFTAHDDDLFMFLEEPEMLALSAVAQV